MKLIDKNALVAEIEKIIEEPAPSHDSQCSWEDGYYCGLCKTESIIDAFKVKEIDLEKIIEQTYHDRSVTDTFDIDHVTYENVARYFFELGLKMNQKGEEYES